MFKVAKTLLILSSITILYTTTDADEEHFRYWENVTQGGPGFPVNNVRFVNGRYFALGGSATIASSIDGENWEVHHTFGLLSESMRDIAYGNGKYVATGLFGTVFVSEDLCNWRKVASGTGWPLSDIIFHDGKFVAVGNFTIITSENGEDWTLQSREEWLSSIAYGNGVFVVSAGMAGQDVAYSLVSEDGENWDTHAFEGERFSDVIFGNGVFVTISPNLDTAKTYVSTDGVNWDQHPQTMKSYNLHMKAFDGEHFIAAGTSFYGISKNGIDWSYFEGFGARTLSVCTGDAGLLSYDFSGPIKRYDTAERYPASDIGDLGNISRLKRAGNRLYAFGDSPGVAGVDSASYAMSSDDGLAWYLELVSDPKNQVIDFSMDADQEFGIVREGKVYNRSPGEGWELVYESSDLFFEKIYTQNATVLVFAAEKHDTQNKRLIASVDGKNWSLVKSFPTSYRINELVYRNGLFAAVGNNLLDGSPLAISSDDGVNWSSNLIQITGRKELSRIVFGSEIFLASGPDLLLRSDNAIDWTEVKDANRSQSTGSIAFDGNQFIRTISDGSYSVSKNGKDWHNQLPPLASEFAEVATISGRTVAFGPGIFGFLFTDDLKSWKQRQAYPEGSITHLTKGHAGFVALEGDGLMLHSPDGNEWDVVPFSSQFKRASSVSYGGGKYVVLASFAYNNHGPSHSSEDGINWKTSWDLDGIRKFHVAYANGHFIALGSNLYATSTDGHSWDVRSDFPHSFGRIIYAQGLYVAAGSSRNGKAALYTSTDEENWTLAHESGKSSSWDPYDKLAYGNGRFVAIARYDDIVYSDFGLNWSQSAPASAGIANGLAFGNGHFFSSSGEGQSYLSSDGINWNKIQDNVSSRIYNTSFFDGSFWAYGLNGNIFRQVPAELVKPSAKQTNVLIASNRESIELNFLESLYPNIDTSQIKVKDSLTSENNSFNLLTDDALCSSEGSIIIYSPHSNAQVGDSEALIYQVRGLGETVDDHSQMHLTQTHPPQQRRRMKFAIADNTDSILVELPLHFDNRIQNIVSGPFTGQVTLQEKAFWYNVNPEGQDHSTVDWLTLELEQPEIESATGILYDRITIQFVHDKHLEAHDDVLSAAKDTATEIDFLANDLLPATSPITRIEVVTPPLFGAYEISEASTPHTQSDDILRYTPNSEHVGIDSIGYEIEDAEGRSSSATIDIVTSSETTYAEWRAAQLDDIEASASEMHFDQGQNGITNLHRYIFGLASKPSPNDFQKMLIPHLTKNGLRSIEVNLSLDPNANYDLEALSHDGEWTILRADIDYSLSIEPIAGQIKPMAKYVFDLNVDNSSILSLYRLRVTHSPKDR